ncbi:dipeptidase [Amphiplicatus metriothermophilus]|uniref:Membrane dipeptidase n=1 Tax=Amphiplicatus metriothermophilus TaxID=1519374 RepID=A0A239PIN7_9PROT|nr:dipeptidase [Amphiplicatus metriothermophilus]MBB5518028.1 membrane dipeptidase [Amphiplicatus metriothermophilus]SNT67638.1 membrane dipeptidase [Amphiplicatus metriothermophilus]
MKTPSAFLSALLPALAAASAAAQPLADPTLEEEARRIHERVLALDTHVDIPLDYATFRNDPGGFTKLQVDLPKMRAGGLDAAFFIVYTPQGPLTPEGYAEARRVANTRIEAIARLVRAYPDEVGVAFTAREARRIARTGKRVALIGMENAYPLGPSVEDVAAWARAGVRYMGITHFGHNQFGDSSNPNEALGDAEERHGGLSGIGRSLVAELNRHGIMVDVSHAGKKTMMQAVALSAAPPIASHSGVKAIADSPRNLDDEQLRALAAKGGVVQIVALDAYVKPLTEEQIALRDRIRKEMGLETTEARAAMTPEVEAEYEKRLEAMWDIAPRATVADFVDHIDYAVKLVGVDHVGVASDFDGGGGVVGWEDAGETLNVTRELVRRGYTEEEIAKIWGGNLLRVMEEVEKTARRLR